MQRGQAERLRRGLPLDGQLHQVDRSRARAFARPHHSALVPRVFLGRRCDARWGRGRGVGGGRARGTRLHRKGRPARRWGPTEFLLFSLLFDTFCVAIATPSAATAGATPSMQRAMLSALLVVCFIGPAHPQGVQTGANQGGSVKDRPRFNQARFDQAMGGIRGQKTTPGGPLDAEPNAKKKAKQERCA